MKNTILLFSSQKTSFIILIFLLHSIAGEAQNKQLLGLSETGGHLSSGNIFFADSAGENLTEEFSFQGGLLGAMPTAGLTLGSNGMMYGGQSTNGFTNESTLFEYDPNQETYTLKATFSGADGSIPRGKLHYHTNNKVYGVASGGGVNGNGVIFELDPITSVYTKVFDFSSTTTGGSPYAGMTLGSNGKLYGSAKFGGANGDGTIFEYDPILDVFNVVQQLDETIHGEFPDAEMISASNGKLYGVCVAGGTNGLGTLFEYDPVGSTFNILHHFDTPTGASPSVLFQASNDTIYMACKSGGLNGFGTISAYDINTANYSIEYNFEGANLGESPSDLIEHSPGIILGVASASSAIYKVLFQYELGNQNLSILQNFDDINTGYGDLNQLAIVSDKVYGLSGEGGGALIGCMFRYNLLSSEFDQLINWSYFDNSSAPTGAMVQTDINHIYGLATAGGTNNLGSLFEYNILSNSYTQKVEFNGTSLGSGPTDELLFASNNKLYGLTQSGGTNDDGTLFSCNAYGNGFTKIIDLNNVLSGSSPRGHLIEGSNGKLYGMTETGGVNGAGIIFKFDTLLNNLTKIHDFDGGVNGSNPVGSLLEANNGHLYGLTSAGGVGDGIIFEFDPMTEIFTKVSDLNNLTDGSSPEGSFYEASNGLLYTVCKSGGANGDGTLLEFDSGTLLSTNVHDFNAVSDGSAPKGSLKESEDGKLFGLANLGGTNNYGTLFEYDFNTLTFSNKHNFDGGVNGALPGKNLTLINICSSGNQINEYLAVCPGSDFTFPDATSINNIISDTVQTSYLTNIYGCDSIIVTSLSVIPLDTALIQSNTTLSSTMGGSTFQWLDCTNGYAPVLGATNSNFTADTTDSYAVEISFNGCIDTSSCYQISNQNFQDEPDYQNLTGFVFVLPVSQIGDCDGWATSDVYGGIPPYTYDWPTQINNDFNYNLDTACDGFHEFKVFDYIGDSLLIPYYIPDSANFFVWVDTALNLNYDTITIAASNCIIDYNLPIDSVVFIDFVYLYDDGFGGEFYEVELAYFQAGFGYNHIDTVLFGSGSASIIYEFSVYCPTKAVGDIFGMLFGSDHPSFMALSKENVIHISAFPNPAKEQINFESTAVIENWEIYSLDGKTVLRSEKNYVSSNKVSINLETLDVGSYIFVDQNQIKIKFVKLQ